MESDQLLEYRVYKGLQRPLIFKGLKGNYIYMAFAIAGIALIAMAVGGVATGSYLTGTIIMLVVGGGGIIGLAVYQKHNGLYQKSKKNRIYIVKNLFTHGIN